MSALINLGKLLHMKKKKKTLAKNVNYKHEQKLAQFKNCCLIIYITLFLNRKNARRNSNYQGKYKIPFKFYNDTNAFCSNKSNYLLTKC